MKKNNSKARIRFLVFGYLIICFFAVSAMYFNDEILTGLSSVHQVLFDSSGRDNLVIIPSATANFSSSEMHSSARKFSDDNTGSMYRHTNTQGDYMQNMASNMTGSEHSMTTVVVCEDVASYTNKRRQQSHERNLAMNTSLPKFFNGKKMDFSVSSSPDGGVAADAVASDETFASQVMQKSSTEVAPSGDPDSQAIPVGDGYYFLTTLLIAYAIYKRPEILRGLS